MAWLYARDLLKARSPARLKFFDDQARRRGWLPNLVSGGARGAHAGEALTDGRRGAGQPSVHHNLGNLAAVQVADDNAIASARLCSAAMMTPVAAPLPSRLCLPNLVRNTRPSPARVPGRIGALRAPTASSLAAPKAPPERHACTVTPPPRARTR